MTDELYDQNVCDICKKPYADYNLTFMKFNQYGKEYIICYKCKTKFRESDLTEIFFEIHKGKSNA